MKKSTKLFALMMALCMSIALVACSSAPAPAPAPAPASDPAPAAASGGYDLTVWVFQDWAVGRAGEIFEEWADAFIASEPRVNSITYVGKPDTEIISGFMAGGSLPDMFTIQFMNGKKIVESTEILNIQPYMDDSWKQQQNPMAMSDLMTNPEGTCWGVPLTANCHILFRNTAILKDCGIDPADIPKTVDELLAQFELIAAKGYDVMPDLAANDWITSAYVCGNPALKVGWENGATTITADQLIPGFEALQKISKYSAAYTFIDDVALDNFTSNKLAFNIFGPFWNPNLEEAAKANSAFTYDAIANPSLVADGPYSSSFGNEWCGAVASDDEVKNEIMAKFMFFISDKAQISTFCRDMSRPVMNVAAMEEIANDPNAPWMLGVCNDIINNSVNQGVPFRCDAGWYSGAADAMFGILDGSVTDLQAAAEESIANINENA